MFPNPQVTVNIGGKIDKRMGNLATLTREDVIKPTEKTYRRQSQNYLRSKVRDVIIEKLTRTLSCLQDVAKLKPCAVNLK